MRPTSRAHRPPALTTCSAWMLPLSVTTSQVPSARWRRLHDARVRDDLGAGLLGRDRVGMRGAVGVDVALVGVVHGADEAALVDQRQDLLGLVERDEFEPHAHVAALGVHVLQPLPARRRGGEHQPLGHVQPARLAGNLLDLLVEVDGVLLQLGDVGIAVDGVHAARRMPRRARRQLQPLEQHDIAPALLGQVIEHARPDDAAADDHDPGMGLHGRFPVPDYWFELVTIGLNWLLSVVGDGGVRVKL